MRVAPIGQASITPGEESFWAARHGVAEDSVERDGWGELMETIELHVATMEAELLRWGLKLDELVAKADVAAAEATHDYHARVDELKGKYRLAQAKLDELKTAES